MTAPVPLRKGQPWLDEEVIQLLTAIRQKKSIAEIAQTHQRTPSGIKSRLHVLAVDYYFNDQKTVEQIMKITGLDKATIVELIKKKEATEEFQEYNGLNSQQPSTESNKESMLLTELQATLQIILVKLESIESDVEQLKKNGSQSSVTEEEDLLLFTSHVPAQSAEYLF